MPVWTPRVTVAAIVAHGNQFLLVKEIASGKQVYNQPAGHLEDNETLIDAVQREMLEETGLSFMPTALIGIYRWPQPAKSRTYLRFAFTGEITSTRTRPQDKDILEALWMNKSEIYALEPDRLRSPNVLAGIEDYLKGLRYNLDILRDMAW